MALAEEEGVWGWVGPLENDEYLVLGDGTNGEGRTSDRIGTPRQPDGTGRVGRWPKGGDKDGSWLDVIQIN